MSLRPIPLPRLFAVLAALAVALFAGTAVSDAAGTSWGDLGHFGEVSSELKAPMAAFGVNPEDGSVWVVETTGTEPEELRLEKFEKVGGAWKVVASRLLGSNETSQEASKEAEGVAFDPKEKRAYVLVTEARLRGKSEEEQVASELWALSTETSGGKIEPAAETKAGVLVPRTETSLTGSPVGKKEFSPDSAEKGTTLFAPGGIAVNPVNDQVLITGWVGSEEHAKPQVWAVSDRGEIQTVWEDATKSQEECGCLTAPVVTSTGRILALGNNLNEIIELPSNLSSATAPKQAFWLPRARECEERLSNKESACPFVEKVAQMDDGTEVGGAMAIGPEGDVYVHVKVKSVAEGGLQDGAVMVLSPTLQEIGWTGGGSWGSATKECAVNESNPGNLGPALVGGFKEHAFMFERGNPAEGSEEEHAPKILELGEGGKAGNCPQGEATPPAAEAGGFELSSFPIADNVTLSSEVTQANALSTEWEFGDETKQTVETRQQQKTLVQHQFKKEGVLTVTEKIHSDDLATPTITVSEKVTVVAPKVQGEAATPEGTQAALKAEVNPMKSPTKCEFLVAEAGEAFTGAGVKKLACPTSPGEAEKFVVETATATGLTAGKHYHFKLLAKAGAWESSQEGTEFAVGAPGFPVVEAKQASEVTATSATLNGTVNPEGSETKLCTFEYGTALPLGKTAPCSASPGNGKAAVAVSAKVTPLTGSTTYKVKLIAENTLGKSESTTGSFTTLEPPAAPSAETGAASPVTQTTATLKGFVDPHGEATTCVFEYGPTTAYGSSASCASTPGGGTAKVEVSAALSGLAANTIYHYRLTATNHTGTTQGADKELKTSPGSSGPATTTEKTTETPPPVKGVEHEMTQKPVPIVTVSGSATSVAPTGAFTLKLSCPAGETTCSGSLLLKTLTAVAASSGHAAKKKKAILTLASASFSIAGGKLKAISLHLTSKAKALLAKLHTVRAKLTIVAHDTQGGAHTTTAIVTLKAVKKKH